MQQMWLRLVKANTQGSNAFVKTTHSVIMCAAGSVVLLRCAVAFFRTNSIGNMIFIKNSDIVFDIRPDTASAKFAY